jgi:cell wall assembly regulator SMI1
VKEDDTIIGQGMVMVKNVGGMWEPIKDRRTERRVAMLERAHQGDFSQLEAKLTQARAELAQAEVKMMPKRIHQRNRINGQAMGMNMKLQKMRQMVQAYERIIELYRSGAA